MTHSVPVLSPLQFSVFSFAPKASPKVPVGVPMGVPMGVPVGDTRFPASPKGGVGVPIGVPVGVGAPIAGQCAPDD